MDFVDDDNDGESDEMLLQFGEVASSVLSGWRAVELILDRLLSSVEGVPISLDTIEFNIVIQLTS